MNFLKAIVGQAGSAVRAPSRQMVEMTGFFQGARFAWREVERYMVLNRAHTEKSDSGDSTRPLRMLSYITAVMVSIFVAWFTGYIRTDGTLDTDGWFLLATGREIVHNGIPFENPWSLDPGQGIIVQQWLHDVWLYGWYSLAGYTGVATSVVVPLAIAAIAYYFLIERLTRGCRHQGITWLLYAVGFF